MFLSTFTIIIKTNKICHNIFPVWPFLSHIILFSSPQGKSLVTKPDTVKIIHQPVPFDKTLIKKKTVHLNFNEISHFGPSGVRALVLAAGINEGGLYFR